MPAGEPALMRYAVSRSTAEPSRLGASVPRRARSMPDTDASSRAASFAIGGAVQGHLDAAQKRDRNGTHAAGTVRRR